MAYETVIGLEVHVQLNTKTKAFCGCAVEYGKEPNTLTCPVCLGFPGSLPMLNKTFFEHGITVALALHCEVQRHTKFDRKNYFYPDLPKNFQISQFDLPLSRNGFLEIESEQGLRRIGITRVHMEEDAGKLIHLEDASLVDLNRAGTPLLEIVSEPDIRSPQEAYDYLTALKSILQYTGVSDCDMEKGILRCDANISLRLEGAKEFGEKVELKNMNSFRAVKEALTYEVQRQADCLDAGEKIIQETRLWDAKALKTASMRSKEGSSDYRYFPEPDLPLFEIEDSLIDKMRKSLPEMPKQKKERLMRSCGLPEYEAKIITQDKAFADYFEACFALYPKAKPVSNWLIGPVLAELNSRGQGISDLRIPPKDLIELIDVTEKQVVSHLVAKDILGMMFDAPGQTPDRIIAEKGLAQISDASEMDSIVEQVINENPKIAQDFIAGKEGVLMFLVGQVMKKSAGKANPKVVQELLRAKLKK